jgi:hypothetical protein
MFMRERVNALGVSVHCLLSLLILAAAFAHTGCGFG